MTSFLVELRADFRTPVIFLIWSALSVVVALSGPFGSYDILAFPQRLLIWSAVIAFCIAVSSAVRAYVHGTLGLRDFQKGSPMIAVLLSMVLAPPVHYFSEWMEQHYGLHRLDFRELVFFIFATSISIGAFRHALSLYPVGAHLLEDAQATVEPEAQGDEGDTVLPRVVQRLEAAQQGRLISISVRNHYVDVVTDAGRGSILMRLADAMTETEGEDGAQVHRSHWVAWWAVRGIERRDGKLYVTLAGGTALPASRTHRRKLEERGLL